MKQLLNKNFCNFSISLGTIRAATVWMRMLTWFIRLLTRAARIIPGFIEKLRTFKLFNLHKEIRKLITFIVLLHAKLSIENEC